MIPSIEEEISQKYYKLLLAAIYHQIQLIQVVRGQMWRHSPSLKNEREGNRQEDVVFKSSVFVKAVSLWAFLFEEVQVLQWQIQ